jgi:hypothetical protein
MHATVRPQRPIPRACSLLVGSSSAKTGISFEHVLERTLVAIAASKRESA